MTNEFRYQAPKESKRDIVVFLLKGLSVALLAIILPMLAIAIAVSI